MRRPYCLIPSRWSLDCMKKEPPCFTPGSHVHLSTEDVYGPRRLSTYPPEIIYQRCAGGQLSSRISPDFKGEGGQLDLGLIEWIDYGKVLRVKYQPPFLTGALLRGLSARVGEYLVQALRRHEPWATMMLIDMRHQIVPPADESDATLARIYGGAA